MPVGRGDLLGMLLKFLRLSSHFSANKRAFVAYPENLGLILFFSIADKARFSLKKSYSHGFTCFAMRAVKTEPDALST